MDPWFSPETGRLFAMMSLLAFAATLEPLARQGRARAAVLTTFASCIGVGLALRGLAAWRRCDRTADVVRPLIVGGLALPCHLRRPSPKCADLQRGRAAQDHRLRLVTAVNLPAATAAAGQLASKAP